MQIKKIFQRATSALLAGVIGLSAFPINAFASSISRDNPQTLADSISSSNLMEKAISGTYEFKIKVSNNGADKIQSANTSSLGAYPNYLSADSRPEYNLATNIFYCGATGLTLT